MSSYPHHFASAWLITLIAVLAGGPGFSIADEPPAQPTAKPIELEFESLEAPGLKDLKRAGQYPPPTFSTPGGLPPEIQKIQQDLGGSVVNQFPSLQSSESPRASSPTTASRDQLIAALRDAAWSMDSWANRLEALEAYAQADALRAHAQRLRVEARAQVTPAAGPSDAAPRPTLDPAPTVEISPALPATAPTELR